MNDDVVLHPPIEASAVDRATFLRRVAAWTVGGLVLTGFVSVASALFIAPAILKLHWLVVLAVVYGSFFLAQTVARGMVYGEAKVPGFLLGTAAQGISLGFLLFVAAFGMGDPADGLSIIGYSLAMVVLAALAMMTYVSVEKREFSMLRAGLAMLGIPMLILMGLQFVLPMGGAIGVVIAGVFLAVSVGSLLWKLNFVAHTMETNMPIEGGYELTLGIVVLFWNLLSFLMRLRRR
jgi:FtsH-binding integral membrane protein